MGNMSMSEAMLEHYEALTEEEQYFLLNMLISIGNGLVNSISYEESDVERENTTITHKITIV
jgi:hypothetical protein